MPVISTRSTILLNRIKSSPQEPPLAFWVLGSIALLAASVTIVCGRGSCAHDTFSLGKNRLLSVTPSVTHAVESAQFFFDVSERA